MAKDAKTIREELARPFAPEDLEWRIQVTSKDKTSGLAIPYVTNRAIQDRLDEVVGPENWYNDYKPWHGNGKKDAQICGISIYFEGKGFITKWDGAEDSDIEPIKGGLSDSMKRSAVQWGIGRVLYKMTKPLWVKIEQKGNSYVICDTERPKLNAAYLELLDKLHQLPTSPGAAQAQLSYKRDGQAGQQAQNTAPTAMPQTQQQAPQQPPGPAPELPGTAAASTAAAPVYDAAGLPVRCVVCEQSAGYVRPAVGLRRSAKRRGQAGEGLRTGQSSHAYARRAAL